MGMMANNGRAERGKETLRWSVSPAHSAAVPQDPVSRGKRRVARDRRVGEKRPPEGAVGRCPVALSDRADKANPDAVAEARAPAMGAAAKARSCLGRDPADA